MLSEVLAVFDTCGTNTPVSAMPAVSATSEGHLFHFAKQEAAVPVGTYRMCWSARCPARALLRM